MSEVKVTYDGVEIVYSEREDKWVFELRGRERKAESLAKAKGAIDKPDPKEKDKKPFERCKAYKVNNWGDNDFRVVEVTSIADSPTWSRGNQVWIMDGGQRRKEDAGNLAIISAENTAKVSEWAVRKVEIDQLEELNRSLATSMERLKLESQ